MIATAAPTFAQQQRPSDLKQQLQDTSWQLVSLTITTPDGKEIQPQGPNPLGYTMFDKTSHFMTETMRPDVPKFASGNFQKGTDSEYITAAKASLVDFGTYSADDKTNTIVLHVVGASFPNWSGTDLSEQVHMRGDQMIWKTVGGGATQAPTTLVWKRMK